MIWGYVALAAIVLAALGGLAALVYRARGAEVLEANERAADADQRAADAETRERARAEYRAAEAKIMQEVADAKMALDDDRPLDPDLISRLLSEPDAGDGDDRAPPASPA